MLHWTEKPHVFGLGGMAEFSATAGPFLFLIVPVGRASKPVLQLAMHYRGGTVLNTSTHSTADEAKDNALPMALRQLEEWREEVSGGSAAD